MGPDVSALSDFTAKPVASPIKMVSWLLPSGPNRFPVRAFGNLGLPLAFEDLILSD